MRFHCLAYCEMQSFFIIHFLFFLKAEMLELKKAKLSTGTPPPKEPLIIRTISPRSPQSRELHTPISAHTPPVNPLFQSFSPQVTTVENPKPPLFHAANQPANGGTPLLQANRSPLTFHSTALNAPLSTALPSQQTLPHPLLHGSVGGTSPVLAQPFTSSSVGGLVSHLPPSTTVLPLFPLTTPLASGLAPTATVASGRGLVSAPVSVTTTAPTGFCFNPPPIVAPGLALTATTVGPILRFTLPPPTTTTQGFWFGLPTSTSTYGPERPSPTMVAPGHLFSIPPPTAVLNFNLSSSTMTVAPPQPVQSTPAQSPLTISSQKLSSQHAVLSGGLEPNVPLQTSVAAVKHEDISKHSKPLFKFSPTSSTVQSNAPLMVSSVVGLPTGSPLPSGLHGLAAQSSGVHLGAVSSSQASANSGASSVPKASTTTVTDISTTTSTGIGPGGSPICSTQPLRTGVGATKLLRGVVGNTFPAKTEASAGKEGLSSGGPAPATSGIAPVSSGGIAPVSIGGITPVSSGGSAPVSIGGITSVSSGGIAPVARGGIAPMSIGGITPVSSGGIAPVSTAGIAPVASGTPASVPSKSNKTPSVPESVANSSAAGSKRHVHAAVRKGGALNTGKSTSDTLFAGLPSLTVSNLETEISSKPIATAQQVHPSSTVISKSSPVTTSVPGVSGLSLGVTQFIASTSLATKQVQLPESSSTIQAPSFTQLPPSLPSSSTQTPSSSLPRSFTQTPSSSLPRSFTQLPSFTQPPSLSLPPSGSGPGSLGVTQFGASTSFATKQPELSNVKHEKVELSLELAKAMTDESAKISLLSLLAPKGSWLCGKCYLRNLPEVVTCSTCKTPKSDLEMLFSQNVESPSSAAVVESTSAPPSSTIQAPSFIQLPPSRPSTSTELPDPSKPLSSTRPPSSTRPTSSTLPLSSIKPPPIFPQPASFLQPPQSSTQLSSSQFNLLSFSHLPSGSASNMPPMFTTHSKGVSQPAPFTFSHVKPLSAPLMQGKTQADSATQLQHSIQLKLPTISDTNKEQPQSPVEDDDKMPEEEADVHFDPIIKLPDKVALSSGEENEEVLFSHRSKLYRFDSNQWKERGAGDIKILEHKTTKKVRVLMRRDQTMKICCNHYINPNMTLQQVANGDRSWSWFTPSDFSDERAKPERMCVKFKLPESAQQFKAIFEKCVASSALPRPSSEGAMVDLYKSVPIGGSAQLWTCGECLVENELDDTECVACGAKRTETASLPSGPFPKDNVQKPIPLKSSTGMWTCEECLEKNRFSDIICISCCANRPAFVEFEVGSEQTIARESPKASEVQDSDSDCVIVCVEEPSPDQVEKAKKYMLPPTFYLYENKPDCPGCRGCDDEMGTETRSAVKEPVASALSKDPLAPPVSQSSASISSNVKPLVPPSFPQSMPPFTTSSIFTSAQSGFSFADLASKSGCLTFADFASMSDSQGFGFRMAPIVVGSVKPLFGTQSEEKGDSGLPLSQDYPPHVRFKPLVSLPELSSISTGEENEALEFSHRAKLYRFDTNTKQWKERGVGDIKILCHKTTGRARVLMRRDQVLKICCNHYISGDMDIKAHGGNECTLSWFTRADFADEEDTKCQKLMVRFRHAENANDFKSVFLKFAQKCNSIPHLVSGTSEKEDQKCMQPKASLALAVTWTCDMCYLENAVERPKCIACHAAKPVSTASSDNKTNVLTSSKPVSTASSDERTNVDQKCVQPKTSLASAVTWTCDICYLENAVERPKCVACNAAKPVSTASSGERTNVDQKCVQPIISLASAVTWTCDTCYLENAVERPKCIACNAAKPVSTASSGERTNVLTSRTAAEHLLPPTDGASRLSFTSSVTTQGLLPQNGGIKLTPSLPSISQPTSIQSGGFCFSQTLPIFKAPTLESEQSTVDVCGGVQLDSLPSDRGVQLGGLPTFGGGMLLGPLPSAPSLFTSVNMRQAKSQKEEAETKRLAEEAEAKRLEEEAEAKRLEETEAKRLEEEAEAKRLEKAEAKRLEEAEAKRLEEEAEAKRLEEAEAKRLEKEAEAKRLEKEAEAKRLEKEAEAKRLEKEAEAKRLEEAEAKRLEKEAEAKRLEEAEARRLEEEAEAKRQEEAEAKRLPFL